MFFNGARRTLWVLAVLLNSVFAVTQDRSSHLPANPPTQARHLLGISELKPNVNGKLQIGGDGLTFTCNAIKAQIAVASIDDVFIGQDTRQTGGKAMTVTKMAVPYAGGRVLSLFTRAKFDALTIVYRDDYGGLHAAIFSLPLGQATAVKKQLIAIGVRASTPAEQNSVSGGVHVSSEELK